MGHAAAVASLPTANDERRLSHTASLDSGELKPTVASESPIDRSSSPFFPGQYWWSVSGSTDQPTLDSDVSLATVVVPAAAATSSSGTARSGPNNEIPGNLTPSFAPSTLQERARRSVVSVMMVGGRCRTMTEKRAARVRQHVFFRSCNLPPAPRQKPPSPSSLLQQHPHPHPTHAWTARIAHP